MKNLKSKIKKILNSYLLILNSSESGQSLVELLLTIGLAAIIIPALFSGVFTSRAGQAQEEQRVQAYSLAREGQEAARIVRDNDWASFAVNGTYHPVVSGTTWTLSSGQESIQGFTRQIVIANAYRDAQGKLSTNGTTLDPSVKLVATTVSWTSPLPSSVVLTSYFTRLKAQQYLQTTFGDFSGGTTGGTTITYTNGSPSDGQIQLGAGGQGDWCNPNKTPILTYDLTRQGIPTSISATYSASMVHTYTTSGFNASGYSLDSQYVSDPPSPTPPAVSSGPFYDLYKTYGIYAIGNYVYTTTNHPGTTIDVENVSGGTFTQAATYNAGGAGISVAVSGNTGYVTVGSTLYSFDTSNLSGTLSQKGSKALGGVGNKVVIVGNYAFVATSFVSANNPHGQLQILDVSNPSNMSIVSTVNVGNNLDGIDVFVNSSGSYAYLATAYASGKNDFYIIDTSNKSSPVVHGSYSTSGMNPLGVSAVSGNRAIIVGTGGQPYQVLNITNVDNPVYCMPQGFSLTGVTNVRAVSSLTEPDGEAYSYILTDNSSAEYQIIQGGPGGQFSVNGTFTSSTYATNSAAFNRFDTTSIVPSGTTLSFQVAIINKVSGSCPSSDSSYVYFGPSGTSSPTDVFPSSGGILPLVSNSGSGYANPGECLRYKAYFTSSDSILTPVLEDITFSYSP
ncbi:MAG TPA: hypothetical protein VF189_03240 [Patescibacteria group bacterium]